MTKVTLALKGGEGSGWYGPPEGTHEGEGEKGGKITTTVELNEKQKQFVSGFVNGGEKAATWVASLTNEKLTGFMNSMDKLIPAENYSENLIDMLHTARLDGRITVKQVAWWQRELVNRIL